MNRKQLLIAGIVITVLLVGGVMSLRNNNPDDPLEAGQNVPVYSLSYCSEEQVKPCVVSFSVDVDGNMLVNILLPDLSYPNFYLKIIRGEGEANYKCQRVSTSPNSAYCTGEKLPPGEILHLMLISIRDETILAEGDLSIIGLALPTLEVAIATSQEAPTMLAAFPTSTPRSPFVLPTPTGTQPSYPNPSYPNPSYP